MSFHFHYFNKAKVDAAICPLGNKSHKGMQQLIYSTQAPGCYITYSKVTKITFIDYA